MKIPIAGGYIDINLFQVCLECQGRADMWFQKRVIVKYPDDFPDHPGHTEYNPTQICPKCNGSGRVPSKDGQEILDLFRPLVLEMVKEARKD